MTEEEREFNRLLFATPDPASAPAPRGSAPIEGPEAELDRMLIPPPAAPAPPPESSGTGGLLETVKSMLFRDGTGPTPGEGAPLPAAQQSEEISKLDSFGTGLQDSVTLGTAGAYRGGKAAFDQTLSNMLPESMQGLANFDSPLSLLNPLRMVREGAGALNSIAQIDRGEPLWNSDEYEARVDKELAANKWSGIAGQAAGALVPGTATAKGTVWGLNTAAKLGTTGGRAATAEFFANTRLGRVLIGTATSAGEGAVYAKNKDENVAMGAALGAGGGLLGGIAGETLTAGLRTALGTDAISKARSTLAREARMSSKSTANPEGVIGLEPGATVRPDSTLMDVNRGARETLTSRLRSPDDVDDFWMARELLEGRQDRASGELAQFGGIMKSLMPKGFTRQAGNITDGARAGDTVKANAKSYYTALQSEYSDVLKGSKVEFDPNDVEASLQRAIHGAEDFPDEGMRNAWTLVEKLFVAERPTNAKQMLNLRKSIDHRIDDALSPTASSLDKSARRSLVKAREAVNEFLETIPGFAEVNAKYASERSYGRAFEVGQNVLKENKATLSPEALHEYMESVNPGDFNGFFEGVTRDLMSTLDKGGGERRLLRKISQDKTLVKKLHQIFPNTADQMIEAVDKVIDNLGTTNEVLSGSRTSLDIARGNRVAPKSTLFDKIVVALTASNMMTKGGFGTSQAAGIGAAKRVLPSMGSDPKFNAELQRLIMSQGQEGIDKALGQIKAADETFRLPVSLAGPDKSLAYQAGELPTTGLAGLKNALTSYDLAGTVPQMLGGMVPKIGLNQPSNMTGRENKRSRRRYKKPQPKSK